MVHLPSSAKKSEAPLFAKLVPLVESVDIVFGRFYDELLSNQVFARHFSDKEQVQRLLVKQKKNFTESLSDSEEELFKRYYAIGVVHFDHDIPYEVFLSGTDLLRETFIEMAIKLEDKHELTVASGDYFKFISEAMAKGYLDEFIKENKRDIQNMLELTESSTFGKERVLLNDHFSWLISLFNAVETEDFPVIDRLSVQNLEKSRSIYNYIKEHSQELSDVYDEKSIDRINFRVASNTGSVLFYLKRKNYSEALSLIINILEIYKLTLILDNLIHNIVVRRAERVIQETTRLSETDPLTNVMNRRKLEEMLENLILRSARTSLPLTVCLLDIDNFKAVNDKYGHSEGDQVLSKVASIIQNSVREHDFVVRYGGEEFLVIFCDTGIDKARIVAEKIRIAIARHCFGSVGHVSASLGLAEWQSDGDQRELLDMADKQLYQAKAKGKNQVCA